VRVRVIESVRVPLGCVAEGESEGVAEMVPVKEIERDILWVTLMEGVVVELSVLEEKLALPVGCENVREELWELNV